MYTLYEQLATGVTGYRHLLCINSKAIYTLIRNIMDIKYDYPIHKYMNIMQICNIDAAVLTCNEPTHQCSSGSSIIKGVC